MKNMRLVLSYVLTLLLYGVLIPAAGINYGTVLDQALGLPFLHLNGFHKELGLAVVLLGIFFISWSFYSIRTVGRGHPHEIFNAKLAPATSRLIIKGPYKYTRNPMCLGFTLLIGGLGIFVGSLSTTIFSAGVYLALGALYLKFVEERGLIKRFGKAYLHYREQVPMIIPALKLKTTRGKNKRRPKRFGLVLAKFRVSEKQKESEATASAYPE